MKHRTLAALLALGLAGCSDGSPRAKNVILISIDTLRPDHLGCYGYDKPTSPAIDRFASEGALFEDCLSTAPWTLPGHATMLTGMYPSTHGVKRHEIGLKEETPSLATLMKQSGRNTYAVVNSHNIGTEKFGLGQGFDVFQYVPEMDLTGEKTKDGFDQVQIVNRGRLVTKFARQMLQDNGESPFFLFLHYYDVHTDFTARPEYEERFVEPYDGKLTRDGQLLTPQLSGYRKRGESITDDDARWLRQKYDAEIAQLDDILKGFFGFLEKNGLRDETLVVITSDHGEEYGEHGGALHGRSQYQELLAIPLILRGPGVPAGQRFKQSVSLIDVVPTILRLTGVRLSHAVDGIDVSLAWRAPKGWPQRFLYGEADHNTWITHNGERNNHIDVTRMVRMGDDKLHYNKVTKRYELYDISNDPFEQEDLLRAEPDETLLQRKEFLKAQLGRFMANEGTGEPLPELPEEEKNLLDQLGYTGEGDG